MKWVNVDWHIPVFSASVRQPRRVSDRWVIHATVVSEIADDIEVDPSILRVIANLLDLVA